MQYLGMRPTKGGFVMFVYILFDTKIRFGAKETSQLPFFDAGL